MMAVECGRQDGLKILKSLKFFFQICASFAAEQKNVPLQTFE
jgi:hypothetical protein